MKIGTVIGNVWATRKEEGLKGLKFLFVQLEDPCGNPVDTPLIAADRIGAGVGDRVMITEGSSSRFVIADKDLPIDAVVIGIVDSIDIEGR
ncbi:ethanolamine utilization protein EutN [Caldalkalibacillus uzonensis]|uniref:Ethanolamine utilization protein EutN n=1 Tax=Caldalkalibacillus uzonensis TaxID=353224 RepID=A0ABU0CQN2_9BACI|nr:MULTISPECIES: EutN/CcmL family microcompartment protein [Caldalkalibacillus]MDQ0338725.1 ethanolamine utilization protein EutN [Caldalkalibacillus uzonensis]GGK29658.1 ethanolamine utilization protein EutN [Caldalkalibacillus thermarum]